MTTTPDLSRSSVPLPDEIAHHLRRLLGEPSSAEALGGMSGSRVARVRGAGGDAVVKGGATAAETEFYETIAPILVGRGVGVPDLLWAGLAGPDRERWLIIEAVPRPLPRERWGPDPATLAALARLHGARVAGDALPTLRAPDAFRPAWTSGSTALALAVLGHGPGGAEVAATTAAPEPGERARPPVAPDPQGDLAQALAGVRAAAHPLFAPECPLSGDPNPANWGLRADGTLVLFDWERFCRGRPALDLAPIVPGLGTTDDIAAVAEGYASAVSELGVAPPPDASVLAREITLAKAWNVVELLAGYGGGVVSAEPVVGWLREAFPVWIRTVAVGTLDVR